MRERARGETGAGKVTGECEGTGAVEWDREAGDAAKIQEQLPCFTPDGSSLSSQAMAQGEVIHVGRGEDPAPFKQHAQERVYYEPEEIG